VHEAYVLAAVKLLRARK